MNKIKKKKQKKNDLLSVKDSMHNLLQIYSVKRIFPHLIFLIRKYQGLFIVRILKRTSKKKVCRRLTRCIL